MAENASGANLLLGKGKVYFDRMTSLGVRTGERFVGNCTKLEVNTTDELKEKYSSAQASTPLLKSVNVRRTAEFALTLDEFTPDNVALALMGTKSALSQGSGGPITAEVIADVLQGCYYPVGGSTPRRKIKSVAVKGPSGTPTYTLTTDYKVDAESGRIYIVEGGGIVDGTHIEVDYSYDAATEIVLLGGNTNVIEGFLRFIGDPATGPILEAEVYKLSFTPDGAIGLIGDDYAEFSLKGKVESDGVHTELYRVIKRTA